MTMLRAVFFSSMLSLTPLAVFAQTTQLPGSTPGVHIMTVSTHDIQVDEIGDVVYSQIISTRSSRPLHMSLLVPRNTNLKPAILYVPGGGFISAEYLKFHEMRNALAAAGFVVAAAEYRVVPETFPAALEDGKSAVRYLRAHASNYGIDPDRIAVLGDSAGGWLAELLGTTNGSKIYDKGDFLNISSDVQAVVSLYGISDVRNIGKGFPENIAKVHESPASTEALLVNGPAFATFPGAPVTENPAKALAASAMGHLNGAKPPFLLMHGSADRLVSPEQSRQLYEALHRHNQQVDYILVEGAGHGDPTWYQPAIINQVVSWFRQTLGQPVTGQTALKNVEANL